MRVIDSHTGGMPTRVVLDGPDLGSGSLVARAQRLAREHTAFWKSVTLEPRGQPGIVGVLLTEPVDPSCAIGAIFFDAGAVLGMCGHAMIGLTVTLAHIGRLTAGTHRIETPAGVVSVELLKDNRVRVTNVESRRTAKAVALDVPQIGPVTGDIAYGGNWFFIVDPSPVAIQMGNIPILIQTAKAVRSELEDRFITGDGGERIDHVIFQQNDPRPGVHSRNFVLCPDDSFDRAPCGTGSSARLACLAADGTLEPGVETTQESVIGSTYKLSYQPGPKGGILPTITGQAFVVSEATLCFHRGDPFRHGICG